MRIERVEGNRKIRVMLSEDDLLEMNINIRMLTPDSPELHCFLFRVMEYVKRETGFNAKNGQVLVEASPSDGGVILTVTKIECKKPISRSDMKSVRAKKKVYPDVCYRFWSFDAMCKYLCIKEDKMSDMRLYKLEDYYFAVSSEKDERILEFAERLIGAASNERFLFEHGSRVAEGAELENLINGIKNMQ